MYLKSRIWTNDKCESAMEDESIQKVAISGPILAALIQRFSSSGAVDGVLSGHVSEITPVSLTDDSSSSSNTQPAVRVATVTGFLCSGTTNSFYDSSGQVVSQSLNRLLRRRHSDGQSQLQDSDSFLGWFSCRRRSHPRPSMREYLVSSSLSLMKEFSFLVKDSANPIVINPSLFLLLTSPHSDQIIHTHEYRAFQFRCSCEFFEPKSIDIVNIGPAFRGHYGAFTPNSPFPHLLCEMRASPMIEDRNDENLNVMKQNSKDQKKLNVCAEGFEVGNLTRLLGSEAANYTAGLEDLYEKMLVKIESLARLVEKGSAQVLEQENHNRKLRYKVARYPGFE